MSGSVDTLAFDRRSRRERKTSNRFVRLLSAARLAPVMICLSIAPNACPQTPRPSSGAPAIPDYFEVAAIKPASQGAAFLGLKSRGLFGVDSMSAAGLLMEAFHARSFQIQGGPGWLRSDLFEIRAKFDPNAMPPDSSEENWKHIDTMLQHLLEERFRLQIHRETRQSPVYALIKSKAGSRLMPTQCRPNGAGPDEITRNPHVCGYSRYGNHGVNRTLDWTGVSLDDLSRFALPNILDRPVLNQTGISGNFDIHLEWTPDQATAGLTGANRQRADAAAEAGNDISPISIFTAVEEQLGLRLEASKGPVEIVVIDHISQPDAN